MTIKTAWAVPTLNRPHDIERLLKSCQNQTQKPDRVIIIDGSKDTATADICNKFSSVIDDLVYYKAEKLGSVTQRKMALRFLQDIDYVLFLDDDFELDEHAFEILLEVVGKVPTKSCFELNFKTIFHGSSIQKVGSGKLFNYLKKMFFLPHESKEKRILPSGGNSWLNEYELVISNEIKEIGWFSGCCVFLPVDWLLRNSTQWDENLQKFGGYAIGEDVFLSALFVKDRNKIFKVMNALGIHHKAPNSRPDFERLIAAKVHNYYLIFRCINENRGPWPYFYFIISLIGQLLLSIVTMIGAKSIKPIKGFFRGVFSILTA